MATPTPGESELDNSSSINNLSSLLAEKGTVTSGTGDDDIETSSIEQLDWSEADEEELQQQELAAAAAKVAAATSLLPKAEVILQAAKNTAIAIKDPDMVIDETRDSNKSGQPLSLSLLESMSSTVDSDGSSKKSVIENWASDVKDAVDRGEMEIEEESAEDLINDDEDEESDGEMTVDEGGNNERTGMRKRIKLSSSKNPMLISSISSFAVDSNIDPLSNAPVLDDGPIWQKGPKRYRFQENRRINQKLTFGVLLAVVLAIGLGLGNLVAYNECEAEYKLSQPKLQESSKIPEQRIRSPDASKTAESSVNDKIPSKLSLPEPYDNNRKPSLLKNDLPDLKSISEETPMKAPFKDDQAKKEEEPSLDSKYGVHMETLTKIVQSLDNLQRKIDKFENNSRRLGGVVVLKDSEDEVYPLETKKEEPALIEEQIHDELFNNKNKNVVLSAVEDEAEMDEILKLDEAAEEEEFIDKLIHGIEETLDYVKEQNILRYDRELDRIEEEEEQDNQRKSVKPDGSDKKENYDFEHNFKVYFEVAQKAEEEFIRTERDELREMKLLGLAEERKPADYSAEEKAEVKRKYDKFMEEYPYKEKVTQYVEQQKNPKPLSEEEYAEHFFDEWKFIADETRDWFGDEGLKDDLTATEHEDDEFTFQNTDRPETNSIEPDAPEIIVIEKNGNTQKRNRNDLQVEPRKDLVATDEKTNAKKVSTVSVPYHQASEENKQDNPRQDFSKGDEEEISGKRLKREKSPRKEYPKKKNDKRGKNFKAQDLPEDASGSGYQSLPEDKSTSSNKKATRYGKSRKENQEDDDGSYNYKQKKSDKKQRNSKEYKATKQLNDYDLDDAEHKRKKYSESNKESYNKNSKDQHHRRGQKEHSDWHLERTKAREDNRQDLDDNNDNSEFNQYHPSSGKKVNNWQVDRDRVREKVRSKNPKNKSYDN